ncbi:WD40-repeat-containing domain protein [Umbelopsis sp. PMI_123]|nr:WD40-repeat-containing domain protein [Umbelopsis sp. PMI_123]
MDTTSSQFEIANPPSDGISKVQFAPEDSSLLLVASWDKTATLYNVDENTVKHKFEHQAAVLDCCFSSNERAYTGSVDRNVRELELDTGKSRVLGSHDDAIKCVNWCSLTQTLFTGSWDKTIRTWDPRSAEPLQSTYHQPHKVLSMDILDDKLVVAMGNRHIYIYDVRNMSETLQKRESSLKYMTRAIACLPTKDGYASSSTEGRVAVEYFDPSPEVQSKKYAFKCHRQVQGDTEVVYPVNGLAFNPVYGTFATGGSDGIVNFWDGINRKRIRQFPRYPDGVASLAFSHDGKKLAIACSYTYDEGEKDHTPDTVYVRHLTESECLPRSALNGKNA